MKIDKESFQRNRFWYLLGAFAPLWLIALAMVTLGNSTKDAQKKFDDSKKNVGGLNNFRNNSFVAKINEKKEELDHRRGRAWERGYDEQNFPNGQDNPIITWPVDDQNRYGDFPKFFGSSPFLSDVRLEGESAAPAKSADTPPATTEGAAAPIDPKKAEEDKERTLVRAQWPHAYRRELQEFKNLASPAYFYGGMANVLRPVEWVPQPSPSYEEIWYSQEDLCVRRELLKMIHEAMDSVAVFRDLDQFSRIESLTELPPTGPFQFQNLNWQVELRYTDKLEEAPKAEGGDAAAAPAPAAPPAPAAGDEGQKQPEKKKTYLAPDSKLTFTNWDGRQGDQAKVNLVIELRQNYVTKEEVKKGNKTETVRKPVRAVKRIEIKGNAIPNGQTATLKDLGITKPLELTGFDMEKAPIDLWLVKDGGDVLPQGVAQRLRLRNGFWYLELLFDRGPNNRGLVLRNTSSLINAHIGRRSLPLYNVEFTIGRTNAEDRSAPEHLLFQGEPVAWNTRVQLKDIGMKDPKPLPAFKLGEVLDVRQVLTWQTAPVKRIDHLALAYNSSRTADHENKRHASVKAPDTPPADAAPKQGGPPDTSGGGGPPMSGNNMGQAAQASSGDVTEVNHLDRRRYVSQSDPVRRMAVGVVLIIDQAYLQEVLAQFTPTNSRLRFHPTQVIWQHAPSIPPETGPESPGQAAPGVPPGGGPLAKGGRPPSGDSGDPTMGDNRGGKPRTGGGGFGGPPPGMAMGGPGTGGMPGTGGGARPPFGPGFGGPTPPGDASSGSDDEEGDANLVELQIYGLVSLFERPPEPKPAEADKAAEGDKGATPGAPTAPGATPQGNQPAAPTPPEGTPPAPAAPSGKQ